jgi:hypothetical protein
MNGLNEVERQEWPARCRQMREQVRVDFHLMQDRRYTTSMTHESMFFIDFRARLPFVYPIWGE